MPGANRPLWFILKSHTEPAGTNSAVAENRWTALGWLPCTHHASLKGLQCMYSSDTRAELNHSWASLPPYMVKDHNGILPSNLWSKRIEECWSGAVGTVQQGRWKLPPAAEGLREQVGRMRPSKVVCFKWRINTSVLLSNVNISWSQRPHRAPHTHCEGEK